MISFVVKDELLGNMWGYKVLVCKGFEILHTEFTPDYGQFICNYTVKNKIPEYILTRG